MKYVLALLFVSGALAAYSQTAWTWTELDTMPVRVSNNAVTHGSISDEPFVFSFGGIDSSKVYSGITDRSFRYNVNTETWSEILPLPVALPLIASSASTVQNKIYIIGGYHVFSNGDEESSNEVIIYDPENNIYLANGTPVPIPIDDQTQAVWRDSLIFVISGWSNSGNVAAVQIYNPASDSWSIGTPVPNLNTYKSFGSSGFIHGDTIFYYGGAAMGLNFPAQKKLRKGVINPLNPTEINWTIEEDAPVSNYRSACVSYGNSIFWIGGSSVSYNYDGIAYNGSGGVEPLYQIARYDAYTQTWYDGSGAPYGQMDLRGIAMVSPVSWIICGGMESGQVVSNRTFLLTYDPIAGNVNEHTTNSVKLIDRRIYFDEQPILLEIYSLDGKLLKTLDTSNPYISDEFNGVFIIKASWQNSFETLKIFVP